jgi:hypothetical protein
MESAKLAGGAGLVVLDQFVASAIHSSYTITDIAQATHELVVNAFEANASNVAVSFDSGTVTLEVSPHQCESKPRGVVCRMRVSKETSNN